MFGEMSSISKKDGRLEGHAKDPISSGLALENFVPKDYWKNHGGEVMILGAGGSAISMGAYLMRKDFAGNYPSKIVITNRSQPRLTEIENIFKQLDPGGIEFEYVLTPEPGQNDEVLKRIKTNSLIVNATGLGKDRPGSPLLDTCEFPENSLVWEINYRGDLRFMHQALEQKNKKKLVVEDGWKYFIHGWTQVIAQVFHIDIIGERLAICDKIASDIQNASNK
jgi:shikimate 5-dehydrogenase